MVKKKIKKTKPRHLFRNAATSRPIPRAVVVRPRARPTADVAAQDEGKNEKNKHDSPGWVTLKAVGGALGTSVLGAYIARQDWLPPKVMTGVLTGLGALLALEGPDRFKSLGLGAMSAAGGQLGFMLIDDQMIRSADEKEHRVQLPQPTTKPATPAPAKRQASDIPADALARAYERARLRMALTADAPN